MKMLKILITLSLALTFSIPLYAATITTEYLTHDSIQRRYVKYEPAGMSGDRPLVIVLHGGNGSPEGAMSDTNGQCHWMEIAETEDFFVVYPAGINNQWHDCRSDAHTVIGTADDVGFINALIDDMDADENLDTSKIFVTGNSNGGMMTMRLFFELGDHFKGFATNIANVPVDPDEECPDTPSVYKSIALEHGTSDTKYMPYSGGYVNLDSDHGEVESSESGTRDFYINYLSTDTTATSYLYPDLKTSDGGRLKRYTYANGTSGSKVVWFKAEGAGHAAPSIDHLNGLIQRLLVGKQNQDAEIAEEYWDFFSSL